MKKQNVLSVIKLGLTLLMVWVIFGCGYTFAPRGEHIDSRIQNVYVAPFGNKTAMAQVENYMRTAFIDEIIQSNRFKSVPDSEQADAIISGNILNISTSVLSYRDNLLAAEERMTVTLEVSFREKDTGKTIWSTRNMTGSADYRLLDDTNPLPARKRALAKLAQDTAENAFNLMMA
ncbi:MAG: putative rane protein, partial [Deltaproteobacteria bacterium]|nr:putative rane protein [Deltaproteobacteria bacterium]